MKYGPKIWKQVQNILGTRYEDFFLPGTMWRPFCMSFGKKFLQKFGKNSFCFNLAFRWKNFFQQKGSLSAEIGSSCRKIYFFCRKTLLQEKYALLVHSVFLQKRTFLRSLFLLSAERLRFSFGRPLFLNSICHMNLTNQVSTCSLQHDQRSLGNN